MSLNITLLSTFSEEDFTSSIPSRFLLSCFLLFYCSPQTSANKSNNIVLCCVECRSTRIKEYDFRIIKLIDVVLTESYFLCVFCMVFHFWFVRLLCFVIWFGSSLYCVCNLNGSSNLILFFC